ncbi:hypothetical protein [Ureibacillus sp. FSL W8-0352]|uniref:hypothetical protein n=1 Tax=Ureibacillus sp. FSL W8-0352 TaxID=2954596 RepID=UPI0030FB358D
MVVFSLKFTISKNEVFFFKVIVEIDKNLEEPATFKKIKDYLFIQVNNPIELACLLKLSLRGYEQTIIYLPELKVIAWVNELIVSLYYQDEKSRKLIETITTTEGLYLRKK